MSGTIGESQKSWLGAVPPAGWRLSLLGPPALTGEPSGPTRALAPLEAQLLAFLALEGRASRAALTGLLWPERPEERARDNLRHLISRLSASRGLIQGRSPVELGPAVRVDIRDLETAAATLGDTALIVRLARTPAEILAGIEPPARSEVAEWLAGRRLMHRRWRVSVLLGIVERAMREERTVDLSEAAGLALDLDPTNEAAMQGYLSACLWMRLRPPAERAYAAFLGSLRSVGLEPQAATADLIEACRQL